MSGALAEVTAFTTMVAMSVAVDPMRSRTRRSAGLATLCQVARVLAELQRVGRRVMLTVLRNAVEVVR